MKLATTHRLDPKSVNRSLAMSLTGFCDSRQAGWPGSQSTPNRYRGQLSIPVESKILPTA